MVMFINLILDNYYNSYDDLVIGFYTQKIEEEKI